MTEAREITLGDGRTLDVYDTGGAGPAIVWHHGSPQTGRLLEPLVAATAARGMRLVSYARPSYGGSSPMPDRDVASAAGDVAHLLDALRIDRFATLGASGGGPHALACAGLLGERVTAVACLAGIAPYTDAFDWFAGMADDGGLRAARRGREARAAHARTAKFDERSFTDADWAALRERWASLGADAGRAGAAGPDGLIDDDVAFASPWGFELGAVVAPTLVVQGGEDRVIPPAHADWLVRSCPAAQLWLRPRDGHVSILDACPVVLDWLADASARAVYNAVGSAP